MLTLEEAWRMKGLGRRARDWAVTNAVDDLASVDDVVDLVKLRRESIEDTKTDDVRVRLCLKTMKMDLACRCALHYSVYRKPNSKVVRLNVSLYPREDIQCIVYLSISNDLRQAFQLIIFSTGFFFVLMIFCSIACLFHYLLRYSSNFKFIETVNLTGTMQFERKQARKQQ